MKIPKRDLEGWAKDLIDECCFDRDKRVGRYRHWRNIFYTGSDNDMPSKHNRCFSHVDKLSSYLFSPAEVHFNIEFDDDTEAAWGAMAERGSAYLNRQFSRRGCDVAFSRANLWSLVKGATIVKLTWSRGGFEPWVIQPEFFGVLRPDIEELDRQDAFVHTFFMTPTQFRRMLGNHPDKKNITDSVYASFSADLMSEDGGDAVSIGGGYPMAAVGVPGITAPGPQQYGNVDWSTSQPGAEMAPEVAGRLIRVDDLWVWNDEQEDWTTIRYCEPGIIIEGRTIHRNLSDIPHEHPFVKVCSNEVPNLFWGRSEIAQVWQNQKMLTSRLNNIDAIFNLQAKPSRSVIGSPGMTDERIRALLTPGGVLSDPNPMAKVETYKPEMPQGALDYLNLLDHYFDEAGGFTAILQGQGEPGVRAGNHANTLLRTSTPRLRDRALVVEKQVSAFGDLCLKMLRAKDASVLKIHDAPPGKDTFVMGNIPDDASVVVDSHTSSPAFSGDNEQLAFALARAGAMGPEELIEAVHPPQSEKLKARLKAKDKAHSVQLAELKAANPEQWAKAISQGGKRR